MKRDAVLLQVGIYDYYIAGAVSMSYSYISGRSTRTSAALPLTMELSHLGACIERIGAWARSAAQIVALQRHIGTRRRTPPLREAMRASLSFPSFHVMLTSKFPRAFSRSRFRRSMHREERAATAQLRRDSEEASRPHRQ